MTRTILATSALALCLALPAYAQTAASAAPAAPVAAAISEADVMFMKRAAAGDATEIETSKVAVEKSTNPEVKKFAQQMIDDHTKASAELAQIAKAKNVNLPPRDPSIDAMVHTLQGQSSAKFDEEYLKGQVPGHRDAAKLFKIDGAKVSDPQLKQFVAKTTPVIEAHLTHVEHLAAAKGVTAKTSLKAKE